MHKKNVLIITYYWPPAGGPGVQRWLKFVKYLPEFNINPIVYCPENPSYPLLDDGLVADVSDEITILKQPIQEPYKLASIFSKQTKTISKGIIPSEKKQGFIEKLLLFIRGNFFIPDARKNWVKPSVKYLSNYIEKHHIETIITTGPPHSLHLIGLQLKQKFDIKWIADFRDPWTTIGYHKQLKLTSNSAKKHKALEHQVLTTANQIIVTSYTTKQEFSLLTQQPIEVITNGYDIEKVPPVTLDTKFTMAHIGSLLSKRNPEVLWTVLSDLINENASFANDLQLNFVGLLSETIKKTLADKKLTPYINDVGYVSHTDAIAFQKKSQLLLLIEIDSEDTKSIIPGKLFEYMVSERPILALGPKDADVEIILKETNTGHYFGYQDYDALKVQVLNHYEAFKNKTLKSNGIGLQKYSRKLLTERLSKLI